MKRNLLAITSTLFFATSAPLASISASPFSSYQIENEKDNGNPYPLPPGPPSAPYRYAPQASTTGQNFPLAGNVKFVSQGQVTSSCQTVTSAKTTILTTNFTAGPVNKYVEINYSGQFSMGSSTTDGFNRIFLQCAIRLASDPPANDVACAEMPLGYIAARRPRISGAPNFSFAATTTTSAYIGYVSGLTPDTDYTVTFYAYTAATPLNDTGSVCYSNMILRY